MLRPASPLVAKKTKPMTTLDVKLSVFDEVMEFLRREADNRNVPLDVIVSDDFLSSKI